MPSGFVNNDLIRLQDVIVLRPQLSRKKVRVHFLINKNINFLLPMQVIEETVGLATSGLQVQFQNFI